MLHHLVLLMYSFRNSLSFEVLLLDQELFGRRSSVFVNFYKLTKIYIIDMIDIYFIFLIKQIADIVKELYI
jgi:hypothetical protein